MIESSVIPQQAIDYLNTIEGNKRNEAAQMGRVGAREELLNFCVSWYTTARTWRKQSWEDDWVAWQRNADGRYDPQLKSKKKDWQSTAFVDITPSHRENIHAELFRLVAGSRPIMDVTARPGGDPAQAENIRDLELREMEKSRFEVEYNKILSDSDTYGSGIAKLWYELKTEDRVIRVPITEPLSIMNPASVARHMAGKPQILGYRPETKTQVLYRGVRIQHISIWDFFPDPKSLGIRGNLCVERSWISLGEIMKGVKEGYYMPEAGALMREEASNETRSPDKSIIAMERGIADSAPRRLDYQKKWEYFCMYGRLPQKLIYPLLTEPLPVDDAEKLVPAKIFFLTKTILAAELSDDYEGEPPFLKLDYFPVNERFYAVGIPEMLKNPQIIVNEVVNQRLDEGNLALQEGFAVVEKALVNPQELIEGGPGLIVRMNQKALGPNGDVRNAIFPLGRPDVKINAGFTEVHEWERMAQERTSANRVTLGSAGLVHDSNRTLGGQQLLKQTAGEKFAFIAMLQEFTWLNEVFRAYWKLIYAHIQPDDVVAALGQKRAAQFQLMSPEEVEMAYRYEPKGIFEREAKATQQARLASMKEQFGMFPWFDNMANFDQQCKSFNMDPERMKVPEAEAMEIMAKAQQMAQPMAQKMLMDIILGQAAKDVERNLGEKVADMANPELADKAPAAEAKKKDEKSDKPKPN